MKNLRFDQVRAVADRAKDVSEALLVVNKRRAVAGVAAASMALGLTGCSPIWAAKEKDTSGLTEFAVDPNSVALHGIKRNGNSMQVDLERVDRDVYPNQKVDASAVDCGTYDGATNPSPNVWPDGNGVSCHINNVRSGDRDHVEELVTEIAGEVTIAP